MRNNLSAILVKFLKNENALHLKSLVGKDDTDWLH